MSEKKRSAYSEKLRDPRWQKMRLQILERDGWKCYVCGDEKSTLNVHHRWYERGQEPWDADQSQLVTLCETCHESESVNRAEEERWLLQALKRGYMSHDLYQIEKLFLTMRCFHVEEVQLSAVAWFLSVPANIEMILKQYFDAKCPNPNRWPDRSIRPRDHREDWPEFGQQQES